jgi:hypothetical protein
MKDRETHLELLKQAARHIAEGEKLIVDQELRVSGLRRDGRDAEKAEILLDLFRQTRAQHIARRDLLQTALEQQDALSPDNDPFGRGDDS